MTAKCRAHQNGPRRFVMCVYCMENELIFAGTFFERTHVFDKRYPTKWSNLACNQWLWKNIQLPDEFSEIASVFGKFSCFSVFIPLKNKMRFVGCCYFGIRWNSKVWAAKSCNDITAISIRCSTTTYNTKRGYSTPHKRPSIWCRMNLRCFISCATLMKMFVRRRSFPYENGTCNERHSIVPFNELE